MQKTQNSSIEWKIDRPYNLFILPVIIRLTEINVIVYSEKQKKHNTEAQAQVPQAGKIDTIKFPYNTV